MAKQCKRNLGYCFRNTSDHLYLNARAMQLQRHLLLEELMEDWLRDQRLLVQIMPANQKLLVRKDAFLVPMGPGRRILKEPATVFRCACLLQCFSPAPRVCVIDSAPTHPQTPRAGRVRQRAVQGIGNKCRAVGSVELEKSCLIVNRGSFRMKHEAGFQSPRAKPEQGSPGSSFGCHYLLSMYLG